MHSVFWTAVKLVRREQDGWGEGGGLNLETSGKNTSSLRGIVGRDEGEVPEGLTGVTVARKHQAVTPVRASARRAPLHIHIRVHIVWCN